GRARRDAVAEGVLRAPPAAHAAELLRGAGRVSVAAARADRRRRAAAAVADADVHAEHRPGLRADLQPLLVAVHRGAVLYRAAAGRAGPGASDEHEAAGDAGLVRAGRRNPARHGGARHRLL